MDAREPVVVFTTSNYGEAALLFSRLNSAGIVCEMIGVHFSTMTLGAVGEVAPIRLMVPAAQEAAARAVISDREEGAGEETVSPRRELPCPRCAAGVPPETDRCPECRFRRVFLAPSWSPTPVRDFLPDCRSFCRGCRQPSVFREGPCGNCGGELAAIRDSDLLCGNRLHRADPEAWQDDVLLCEACRTVWIFS